MKTPAPRNWLVVGLATAIVACTSPCLADTKTFALIVTNNHSSATDRPDLRYADDDGARYYELFDSLKTPHHAVLLTEFDRATAQQNPQLATVARAPNKTQVRAAIADIRQRVAQARQQGQRTEFYFVFAGHGDVHEGKGRLELADGPIDADFLEHEIVERVGSDLEHIVLDSCNSFFVLNPRRAGGRRFATPADMTAGFAQRHPTVGMLLSTNADADVYEWSELESGIFSHEVRSGLSGAADVNGDGEVSYAELAGFIETANRRIPREQFRPHVFYRGPAGVPGAALFPSSQIAGRRLVLAPHLQRLWIRDPAGGRLLDLHKEPGALAVTVSGHGEQPLYAYQRTDPKTPGGRPEVLELRIDPGPDLVHLASLSAATPAAHARGIEGVFRNLFATPYGPKAYSEFLQAEAIAPAPVYGVSRQDLTRARHYIDAISETGRSQRLLAGSILGAGSLAMFAGAVAAYLPNRDETDARVGGAVIGGLGVLYLAGSIAAFVSTSAEEDLKTDFDARLRTQPGDWQKVVAEMDRKLEQLEQKRRKQRHRGAWSSALVGGILTATGIAEMATAKDAATKDERDGQMIGGAVLASLGLGLGATLAYHSSRETPTERLIKLYREDPGLKLNVQAAPIVGGGFGFGITGTF